MSFDNLRSVLESLFSRVNASNCVATPTETWREYQSDILPLINSPEVRDQFTSLRDDIVLPKAYEAARLLWLLRQRFNRGQEGRPLVGRIRAEAVLKERPRRDRLKIDLQDVERQIAELTPAFIEFSGFQVEGWGKVINAVRNRDSLVITAPTGAGKTETFVLPLIFEIASALRDRRRDIPRFVLLYPRVALLKDQLARLFRYVYQAERSYLSTQPGFWGTGRIPQGIVIGFQFSGIFSTARDTFSNSDIFADDGIFKIVEHCPVCSNGQLRRGSQRQRSVTILECTNDQCGASFRTSVSKQDHAETQPHLLVTTAESLDRLYFSLDQRFESYLRSLSGIVFDEVHLYNSLYGVHIYNLVRRIEELRSGQLGLAKIAASATVSNPERFAAKLFYGDENRSVPVHAATEYDKVPAGTEILYFLQSPEEENRPGAAPTLIQAVMAMGHGVLKADDRLVVFTESRDLAGRLEAQIRDAESRRRLWQFRVNLSQIAFRNQVSPNTNPVDCMSIYLQGECWRGLLGGAKCTEVIPGLRTRPLDIIQVSGGNLSRFVEQGWDVTVATPALEVGVDDERIKATVHYRPPRDVFSFIQRRGRAGRALNQVAYTLMILGNTPADYFYLFRRGRLISGSNYELPLNPRNPVIRNMHDRLQFERDQLWQYMQQEVRVRRSNALRRALWRWIWAKLESCPIISKYYQNELQPHSYSEPQEQERAVRNWVQNEQRTLRSYLSLRWTLREIESEAPDELLGLTQNALNLVNRYLAQQAVSVTEVGQTLDQLRRELSGLEFRETDPEALGRLRTLQERVRNVWLALAQQRRGVELDYAERLYDFLRTLERLFDPQKQWILNSPPDALKIVLQAFFYLHLGVQEEDEQGGCSSRVDFFLPDAYFNEVKPVVLEVRYDSDRPSELKTENITELSSLFIPYRTVYRYHDHPLLSIVDTEHNPEWVVRDGFNTIVPIALQAEGVQRGGAFEPQKVYVKPVRGDDQGQQIVKMCPQCFAVYSINRVRRCHNQDLRAVKLFATPILNRGYEALEEEAITMTLGFLERVQGATTIEGSTVRAQIMLWDQGQGSYLPTQGEYTFEARYRVPVRYSLSSKGIIWRLSSVMNRILKDDDLRQQVKSISIDGNAKKLNEDLILHTAAHLLHKAVASISGVNEQVLEYSYDRTRQEVVLWERYEGGAGISEVFIDALRADPTGVYRELLASALCPVDLAERNDWTSADELRSRLTAEWRLLPDDQFIESVVREAEAERQTQYGQQDEGTRLVCRPPDGPDGCPACIQTTYCTDRDEQALSVSRLVAEAILRSLVQEVDRQQLEETIGEAIARNVNPPAILTADVAQGIYNALLL